MMKKNGFTLAEVLITLAIIGVVATMTLPSLMTNTQEQQAKTGLKKAINTLTEAVNMNLAVEGFDFANLAAYGDISKDSTDTSNAQSLAYILHNRTNIDYAKVGTALKVADSSVFSQVVPLRDGSAIILPATTATLPTDSGKLNEVDNLPLGFVIAYDTNGFKAPNVLSNCDGNVAGKDETQTTVSTTAAISTDFTACGKKGKRVIKDQFLLRLRGTHVQPEGPAANWAFNN